jgi:putative addiction module killer protein
MYSMGYDCSMYTIKRTLEFIDWLKGLRDPIGKVRIIKRLERAAEGNFGDAKPVGGDGVWEMRVDTGPGYRLYYVQDGADIYVMLGGGDKSTQDRDIARARALARAEK